MEGNIPFPKTVLPAATMEQPTTTTRTIHSTNSMPLPQQQQPTTRTQKTTTHLKNKRRYCKMANCHRIVKSQGLCQRHGAKPKQCRVVNCTKQAQGNFDGMCKSHFKAHKQVKHPLPPKPDGPPPEPRGESVYETILPASIRWKASDNADDTNNKMPLIDHLATHFDRGTCWHRNDERRARGLHPVHSSSLQLEGWERELVWMEILLLAGSPHASFRHLARGWGRDKGFQTVLTNFICQRFGNVHRKARSKTNFANDNNKNDPVVVHDNMAANVWDDANYGNSRQTNEALAANLFDSLFDSTTADPTVATTEHNNNNNHHSESKSTDRMNQNSSVHNHHHHPTTTTAATMMQGGNAPPQQEPNMALLPEPTIICCPPAHHTTTAPPLLVETTTTTVPIPQSNHDETILDVQQPQFETAASIQPSDEIVLPITTQTLVHPHSMETTTVVNPTLTQPSHTLPPNYSMELFQQQQQQDPSNHHLLDREVGDDDPLENGVPMAML